MSRIAALLVLASSLVFAQEAPVKKDPQIFVIYQSQVPPALQMFTPPSGFQPRILITAQIQDTTIDGFLFTVTYSTPDEPKTVKTAVLPALMTRYGAVALLFTEAIPSSIKVTGKAYNFRQDIAEGIAVAQ